MTRSLFAPNTYWTPSFRRKELCAKFAVDAARHFNSIPGVVSETRVESFGDEWRVFATVKCKGWGTEEGIIEMGGASIYGLVQPSGLIIPILPYEYVARTVSGERYIWFEEGMGFCRAVDGLEFLLMERSGLVFAEPELAKHVDDHGGYMEYKLTPEVGLTPVFFYPNPYQEGSLRSREKLYFDEARDFRRGALVTEIYLSSPDTLTKAD